jgi:hypothetical protein
MSSELPQNLRAPKIPRRLRLTWIQGFVLPVIMALPVAAMLGYFGESETMKREGQLSVEYSEVTRHGLAVQLRVWPASARVSAQYLASFSLQSRTELEDGSALYQLKADEYGQIKGEVSLPTGERVELNTISFP